MNVVAWRWIDKGGVFRCGNGRLLNFKDSGNGFIVAPFSPGQNPIFYPFEEELDIIPQNILRDNVIDFPFKDFNKKQYKDYIDHIIASLNGDCEKKIVASRRLTLPPILDPDLLFNNICKAYPDAFVFLISTSEFGTWIGASPELLLEKLGRTLHTMSLAGTRKITEAGNTHHQVSDWDEKNQKEQLIVTDFITTVFQSNGLTPHVGTRVTQKAGFIEHLMTPIEAETDDSINILSLLHDLSPTPALSGCPRAMALKTIRHFEGDRVLYGGFCGPLYDNGDFRLGVILRCAYLSPYCSVLFAGGGITTFSVPEEEWIETENKLATLTKFF